MGLTGLGALTGGLVPGGSIGLWLVAAVGFIATAVALGRTFVPPPGSNTVTFELNLIVQAALMIAVGLAFYLFGRRRRA